MRSPEEQLVWVVVQTPMRTEIPFRAIQNQRECHADHCTGDAGELGFAVLISYQLDSVLRR